MLLELVKPIVAGTPGESWLVSGKLLNPYQKKVLESEGISLTKWTHLLNNDTSPLMTDVVKICRIIGIKPEQVVASFV
ncbi:MAG: hypothetical protein IPO86_10100 [Saprospiraceae bacterium]|nr:hypothetical protein [Saprospiraceae bacterium]MBK9728458.1 hypothetical protein [Saprospiraceae bacterium]